LGACKARPFGLTDMLDMFADDYAAAAAPRANEGALLPATFGESFQDAWQSGQDAVSSLKQENARNQAIGEYAEAVKGAGGDVDGEYQKEAATSGNLLWASPPDPLTVINNVVAKMKAQADAAGVDMPFTPLSEDDINDRAVQLSQQAIATQQRNLQRPQTLASRVGSLLGEGESGLVDPMNIPAMAIPVEGLGVLATAGLMGLANAGAQTASEIANAPYNERVQPGYAASGQGVENVVGAGVSGALLGGGVKVLGNTLTRLMTGAWQTAAKDAANGVMSEANILNSNEMPAAPATPAEPSIPPDVASASQAVMARVASDRGFTLPTGFDAAETARLSEEAELRERHGVLSGQIEGLPPGDQGAAETLARVRQVESELGEATTADERRELSNRRDELLTDTTPEDLEAAVAPIEQRRAMASEQSAIDDRLQEIDYERGQAQLEQAMRGQASQEPTRIISQNILPGADGEAAHNAALGKAIGDVLKGDPVDVSSAIPPGGDFESRIGDLPSDYGMTAPISEGEPVEAAPFRPGTMTPEDMQALIAPPETANAMRVDVERAIDEAAQNGKALQIPIGVDYERGSMSGVNADSFLPIFGSVADQLAEVDRMNEIAAQILACATPGAMAAE
jgi:hypothetical protein